MELTITFVLPQRIIPYENLEIVLDNYFIAEKMSSELVEIKKEQHVMTREENIWYSSEAKDTEVMTRVIFWNDFDDIIYEL